MSIADYKKPLFFLVLGLLTLVSSLTLQHLWNPLFFLVIIGVIIELYGFLSLGNLGSNTWKGIASV